MKAIRLYEAGHLELNEVGVPEINEKEMLGKVV